jgi:membrane-bound metal-dependent hydrolase YbcI (DUF457 family)
MFLGHFGAGLAAKAVAPRVSLGWLFLAAQFIDLLWPTLLLLGIERVRIAPGTTVVTPLLFEHYPISHSLLAVCGWGALVGAFYFLIRRERRGAVILAVLVVSHWLFDLLVHQPDLLLYPGGASAIGFNLWSSLPATLALELLLFGAGVLLYSRATAPKDGAGRWGFWGLVIFLLLIYAGNIFGAPPPSSMAVAWVSQAQWLLVIWGYWVDRHRRVAGSA